MRFILRKIVLLLLCTLLAFIILPPFSSSSVAEGIHVTKININSNKIVPASLGDLFNRPLDPAPSQNSCNQPSPPPTRLHGFSNMTGGGLTGNLDDDTCKNEPPIADAGPDQSVDNIDKPIRLSGSNSHDPDGDPIASYSWSQIGGPSVALDNPSSEDPQFTIPDNIPHNSEFTFQLKVADDKGDSSSPSKVSVKLSCLADIWVSAFLPPWTANGRVPNPVPILSETTDPETHRPLPPQLQYFDYHEFATDSRNIPQKGGSARQWSYVVVDLCSQDKPLVKKLHGVGLSHGYRKAWQEPSYDKLVEVVDCARAGAEGMKEEVTRRGDTVNVHLEGSTPIPFVRMAGVNVAPNIDYSFDIQLIHPKDQSNSDKLLYRIHGWHDGFPAYEIFIGKAPNIYFHTPKVKEGQNPLNPLEIGQSLLSLFPPMEFEVNVPKMGFDSPNFLNMPVEDGYDSMFVPPTPTEASEPIHPCESSETGNPSTNVDGASTSSPTSSQNNNLLSANDQSITTNVNNPITITLGGSSSDPNADLSASIVTNPSHGTLSAIDQASGKVTYTPNDGYAGPDSFAFKVNDGKEDSSNTGTVSIDTSGKTSTSSPALSNPSSTSLAIPTANDQSITTNVNTPIAITLGGSSSDPNADLTATIVNNPSHGTLSSINQQTGVVNYTPNQDYTGPDNFTFKVNDGKQDSSNTGVVNIIVR